MVVVFNEFIYNGVFKYNFYPSIVLRTLLFNIFLRIWTLCMHSNHAKELVTSWTTLSVDSKAKPPVLLLKFCRYTDVNVDVSAFICSFVNEAVVNRWRY